MDTLKELVNLCKCSVTVEVNPHRDYYQTVESYLSDFDQLDIESDILKEMISIDTIIRVQAYPNSPVGFYDCYHYDLEICLSLVLEAVKGE